MDLNPWVRYVPQNIRPGTHPRSQGKIFMLVTDKDGDDQLSEVPESFYAPEVPVESPGALGQTPQPEEPVRRLGTELCF